MRDDWISFKDTSIEWSSFKDKKPRPETCILAANYDAEANITSIEMGVWIDEKEGFVVPTSDYAYPEMTHWMELPNLPEQT